MSIAPSKLPLLTPLRASAVVALVGTATIGAAWYIQLVLGVLPCHLCLQERWFYYSGLPLAIIAVLLGLKRPADPKIRLLLSLVALAFLAGTVLGTYHAGVEWGVWKGPTDCTGTLEKPVAIQDFLKQLDTVKIIRCDEIAMRIFGLSLASWNAIVSCGLMLVAGMGALSKSAHPTR